MIQWLRNRRLMLLAVGAAVPLMIAISFWNVIRTDWPFWLACYFVGLSASIFVIWGRQRVGESWSRLGMRQRVYLVCVAAAFVWLLLVLFPDNPSNRLFEATLAITVGLLFLSCYAVFSRVIDRIWLRIHKR
jgi:hypothetical protein